MTEVSIGEAARRSGVTIETIRYYEREGIVPVAARSANGRRHYDAKSHCTSPVCEALSRFGILDFGSQSANVARGR